MNVAVIADCRRKATKRDEGEEKEEEKRKTYHIDNLVFPPFTAKLIRYVFSFIVCFQRPCFMPKQTTCFRHTFEA
jgi:hypothetical protein